jgi:large subunit ribosomal protein L18
MMITPVDRSSERRRIHKRIREKISVSANRPRLCVYRSSKYVYAQIVDDTRGMTLAAASTAEKDLRGDNKHGDNLQAAKIVGKAIAARALAKGIDTVVFDRGGYLYHGRIKAVADAARESGLKF